MASDGYGGGGTGISAACSGNVTVTFTWNGPNPPPPMAVVKASCGCSAFSYTGSAAARPVDNPTQYLTFGLDGLDPAFPTPAESNQNNHCFSTLNAYHYFNDGPGQHLTQSDPFTKYWFAAESYTTYLMYRPPGTTVVDVPITLWTWSMTCSAAEQSDGTWNAGNGPLAPPVKAEAYGNFPRWTNYISAPLCVWRKN